MNLKNWLLNTFIRSEPVVQFYSDVDVSRIQTELNQMIDEYHRLIKCDDTVLEEFRNANPSVTSQLHIKDLVGFRASRLMQDIKLKEIQLKEATCNVKATR